jgi:hypothetical protein
MLARDIGLIHGIEGFASKGNVEDELKWRIHKSHRLEDNGAVLV